MIGPEALLPVGGIIAAFILTRKPKKKSSKKSKGKSCPPFGPIDAAAVKEVAEQGIANGLSGVGQVSSYVGQTLYPKDVNNKAIAWPKSSPWELSASAPEPVVCLYAEIKSVVANLPMPVGPEPGPKKPSDVLTDLLSTTPALGKYYMIKNGDVALGGQGVLAKALNAALPGAGTSANRLALLKLMTSPGTWNRDLYGRTKNTNNWPAYTNNEGQNLGAAWLPRHQSAISKIAAGKMPQRNISLTGSKLGSGSSYALLWIPPLDLDALQDLNVVTDGGMTWDDGSSILNPPPELLSLLS